MTGAWQQRLASAPPQLHNFIRRFSRTAGFAAVVRCFFGSSMQRGAAVLAIRLAERIAARIPDFQRRVIFSEDIGTAPSGVYLSLRLELDDRHYLLLPWTRLDPRAVRRQVARDNALYGGTENIRWVFSAKRLGGMPKEAVVEQLRGVLGGETAALEGEPEPEPEPLPPANGSAAHDGPLTPGAPDLDRLVIVL